MAHFIQQTALPSTSYTSIDFFTSDPPSHRSSFFCLPTKTVSTYPGWYLEVYLSQNSSAISPNQFFPSWFLSHVELEDDSASGHWVPCLTTSLNTKLKVLIFYEMLNVGSHVATTSKTIVDSARALSQIFLVYQVNGHPRLSVRHVACRHRQASPSAIRNKFPIQHKHDKRETSRKEGNGIFLKGRLFAAWYIIPFSFFS